MTKEEATKILAEMLKADTNRTFLGQSERCAVIFALQEMNRTEKPKPQPIYMTDDGKIIPYEGIQRELGRENELITAAYLKGYRKGRKRRKVKKAHWVDFFKEGLWLSSAVSCSACTARFAIPYKYCPNCGAKMEEEAEE